MNSAQKIAASVTLLAVAVLLIAGGWEGLFEMMWRNFDYTDWPAIIATSVGVLLAGGAAVVLLSIKRKRPQHERKPEA